MTKSGLAHAHWVTAIIDIQILKVAGTCANKSQEAIEMLRSVPLLFSLPYMSIPSDTHPLRARSACPRQ